MYIGLHVKYRCSCKIVMKLEIFLYRFSKNAMKFHESPLFHADGQTETTLLLVAFYSMGKGKTIPLQAWTGREGSRNLRLPEFKTIGT